MGGEGDPLGGCEVSLTDTQVWEEATSKRFPPGQCIDCSPVFPPDEMLPLCYASLRVHPCAGGEAFAFHPPGFSASKCKALPSCAGSWVQTDLSGGPPCLSAAFCFSVPGPAGNTCPLSCSFCGGGWCPCTRSPPTPPVINRPVHVGGDNTFCCNITGRWAQCEHSSLE